MLILLLVLGTDKHATEYRDRCDLIELNRVVNIGENGTSGFSQVIFWENRWFFHDEDFYPRLTIRSWKYGKDVTVYRRYAVVVHRHMVWKVHYKRRDRTVTVNWDPEIADRKWVDKPDREPMFVGAKE